MKHAEEPLASISYTFWRCPRSKSRITSSQSGSPSPTTMLVACCAASSVQFDTRRRNFFKIFSFRAACIPKHPIRVHKRTFFTGSPMADALGFQRFGKKTCNSGLTAHSIHPNLAVMKNTKTPHFSSSELKVTSLRLSVGRTRRLRRTTR